MAIFRTYDGLILCKCKYKYLQPITIAITLCHENWNNYLADTQSLYVASKQQML